MKPPANAIQIAWQRTVDGNPALCFRPRIWDMIRKLAERQGAPSPQDLITRCVSDLINFNVKAHPTGPVKIKFEWATYGEDPEAMLVFHAPIAQLWQLPEVKAHDMMALALLKSLESELGQSGTA
jgi:hypothetical protein